MRDCSPNETAGPPTKTAGLILLWGIGRTASHEWDF